MIGNRNHLRKESEVLSLSIAPNLKAWAQKADRVLTLLSCLTVPAIAGGAVVLALEHAPAQRFESNTVVSVHPGDYMALSTPTTVRTETKKALYRVRIFDSSGEQVYVFPDQLVTNPREFRLTDYKVRVPSLRPGQYQVRATLIYWFNPFKNGTVEFDLIKLVVSN
jgi:hypothetical protein